MNEVLYEGKSKTVLSGPEDDTYIIRFNDSLTAFNGEKKEVLSGKGRLNAEISAILYDYLGKNGIKTHYIKTLDETSILVKKAEIIMVELIIRNTAAGSFSKKYGVAEGAELKNTVVEFSLKSDSLGDPMINRSQITAIGIASFEELDKMTEQALKINDLLCGLFLKAGIKLIDFKLEFGRINTMGKSEIVLCDEISPDSCRLWDVLNDEKLDKDRFRRDMGGVLEAYIHVLEKLKNG